MKLISKIVHSLINGDFRFNKFVSLFYYQGLRSRCEPELRLRKQMQAGRNTTASGTECENEFRNENSDVSVSSTLRSRNCTLKIA